MTEDHIPKLQQGALPGAWRLGYPLLRGGWDEMTAADGSLRPQWEGLAGFLSALPESDLARRWDLGLRLIRENGVTFNVYGDPRGLDRLWQLDSLPMLLTAEEWQGIEAGLTQRARLLDRILADVYGPQTLLAKGLLPPALVFAHPGYLRPLRHALAADASPLPLYAADIARDPDGGWRVLGDRCEAPSGVGYALENRAIIGRTLPELLRSQPVQPLTPFLQTLRDTLEAASPRRRGDAPRVVLLTPGPYNESYFEHAYLARHLGYTLVESADLTVRDGRVWLKTLDGLQSIDVILRRTSGIYCDPLELRSDSLLGVAGLCQAVRAGTVRLVNALGSGVLEGGGLAPFLPALCRVLLGEELMLSSATAWWCGDAQGLSHALAHLDRLVIRRLGSGAFWFGEGLTETALAELRDAVLRQPHLYTVQECVRLSTVPVEGRGRLEPRPMALRVFLAAQDGGYAAMPGGLTRFAAELGGAVVSAQQGGGSKDTWVLGAAGQRAVPSVRSSSAPPVRLVTGTGDLPSRVADNMFWFGRYLERGENQARLLRGALSRAGAFAGLAADEELPVVLSLLRRRFRPPAGLSEQQAMAALARMAFDPDHMDSPRFTVERVHRMASLARDRLSLDTWRAVNALLEVSRGVDAASPLFVEDALAALNRLILASEALSGLVMENMTRGPSWRFVDIGRRLERGVHAVELLSGVVAEGVGPGGEIGDAALEVLLDISDSAMTYRSRYLSAPQFAPVLELLLVDDANPRALGFQASALAAHMDQLAAHRRSPALRPEQRLTIWLTGAVRTADVEALATADVDGERRNLAGFLEVLRSKLWELSAVVTREYFTLAANRGARLKASGGAR